VGLANLASVDRDTVAAARRDLISGGRELVPRVLPSLGQGTLEFRFRVAEVLLSLERGQPDAVGFLKKVFLDPQTPELMRRESAFGIASNDSDWGFLLSHLNNPEVQIRRAILFVLDDATERTDIPKDILEALPQIQKLRKDRDGLVSGLAREVSEQIERCRKSNPR
jgi:hypothetical protein